MAFADDYYVYFEDGSDDEYYDRREKGSDNKLDTVNGYSDKVKYIQILRGAIFCEVSCQPDYEMMGDSSNTDDEDEMKTFCQAFEDTANDFESEMNGELNEVVGGLEEKHHLKTPCKRKRHSEVSGGTSNETAGHGSSSSEQVTEETKQNDELFYDPNMDDEDQKWVDSSHERHVLGEKKSRKTDAILNCPACMTTLCMDCQRHDLYSTQYRAIFVRNCKTDFSQQLEYPEKKSKAKRRNAPSHSKALYNPVSCTICNTQVAVYDSDEVYHFFNVLASYS